MWGWVGWARDGWGWAGHDLDLNSFNSSVMLPMYVEIHNNPTHFMSNLCTAESVSTHLEIMSNVKVNKTIMYKGKSETSTDGKILQGL